MKEVFNDNISAIRADVAQIFMTINLDVIMMVDAFSPMENIKVFLKL